MLKKNDIQFGKKKHGWIRPVVICLLALLAFCLGFLFAKPIMDLFR